MLGSLRRWLVLGLLAALCVRAVYAAPTAFMGLVKAGACCAAHCAHPASPDAAGRCCGVVTHATDPALTASPTSETAPNPALVAVDFAPIHVVPASLVTWFYSAVPRNRAVGPPLYRLTSSLLL